MTWDGLPYELERLADGLRRERETSPSADFLYQEAGRFRYEWQAYRSLTATKLPLPVPRNQGLHPVGCGLDAAFLSFRFVRGDDAIVPTQADYQVLVEGHLVTDTAIFELQDHWRVDTDTYAPPPAEDGSDEGAGQAQEGKESHPLFHFQRGGHAQDAFAQSERFIPGRETGLEGVRWRALLQSPGPRIPALPMDPLLAIDFCIAQSDGVVWRRLRNSPEYLTLIEDAQSRLWIPFFDALQNRPFRRRWLGPVALT